MGEANASMNKEWYRLNLKHSNLLLRRYSDGEGLLIQTQILTKFDESCCISSTFTHLNENTVLSPSSSFMLGFENALQEKHCFGVRWKNKTWIIHSNYCMPVYLPIFLKKCDRRSVQQNKFKRRKSAPTLVTRGAYIGRVEAESLMQNGWITSYRSCIFCAPAPRLQIEDLE